MPSPQATSRLAVTAALMLLSACGGPPERQPAPDCVTSCGARIYGVHDCAAADQGERAAVAALSAIPGWANACSALAGTHVTVMTLADYEAKEGRGSTGITWPWRREIEITTTLSPTWGNSGLAHEYGHMLDYLLGGAELASEPLDCDPAKDPFKMCNTMHPHWWGRGIYRAIYDAIPNAPDPMN